MIIGEKHNSKKILHTKTMQSFILPDMTSATLKTVNTLKNKYNPSALGKDTAQKKMDTVKAPTVTKKQPTRASTRNTKQIFVSDGLSSDSGDYSDTETSSEEEKPNKRKLKDDKNSVREEMDSADIDSDEEDEPNSDDLDFIDDSEIKSHDSDFEGNDSSSYDSSVEDELYDSSSSSETSNESSEEYDDDALFSASGARSQAESNDDFSDKPPVKYTKLQMKNRAKVLYDDDDA